MTASNVDQQAVRASSKLAETADTLTDSTQHLEESTDRRTVLAADRTMFAAERTYAAWVRTGLVALASGVGSRKLLESHVPSWMMVATGTVLILFSAFCFVAAVWRQLYTGAERPMPEVRKLPSLLLVVINGFLALVALTALIGVIFGRSE